MKKLGEHLLEKGVLTKDQLNHALSIQKNTKSKLGNILVNQGYLKESDLKKILAEQYNLSVFEDEGVVLTADTQRQFPKHLIEKFNVIPIKYTDKGFYVGISDVSTLNEIPDLAFALGKNIIPLLFSDVMHEKIISDLMIHPYGESDYFLETFESFLKKRTKGEISLEILVQNILLFDNGIQQIIFSENTPPMAKKIGHFYKLTSKGLNRSYMLNFIKELTDEIKRKKLVDKGYVNFKKTIDKNIFNVTVLKHKSHFTISLKLIKTSIPNLDKIGFGNEILKMIKNPLKGIYLLTAPYGHGKATARASILNFFNNEKKLNILNIEKTIAYDISSRNSLITQYETGPTTNTYFNYVNLSYELDPDLLVVSHIPDINTFETILNFAESGRPVFVTFESGSITGTLEKLFSMVDENQKSYFLSKFTSLLKIILNYKLIPLQGSQRKILTYEYILNSVKLTKMIKDQAFDYINSQLKGAQDFVPIEKKLAQMFKEGKIDLEIAENYANDAELLHNYINQ